MDPRGSSDQPVRGTEREIIGVASFWGETRNDTDNRCRGHARKRLMQGDWGLRKRYSVMSLFPSIAVTVKEEASPTDMRRVVRM